MTRCSMESLVEALHDHRLGERERASVGRHLATCSSCKHHASELRSLGELAAKPRAPIGELDHLRGRVRLLKEAALPPADDTIDTAELGLGSGRAGDGLGKSRSRSRFEQKQWYAIPALVLAAALLGGLVVSARTLATPSRAPVVRSSLRALAAGLRITVVGGDPDARFERSRDNALELVSLTEGAVHVRVHHLQTGQRFVVKTNDAEVEVRGTRFDVEAIHGYLVRVTVSEGFVELRRDGETRLLPAGSEWRPSNAPPVVLEANPKAMPPPSVGLRGSRSAPKRAPSDASRSLDHAVEHPTSASPEVASSDDAEGFRSGMVRLEKGDFGQAALDLGRFAAAHPKDPRAEDAAFLEALSLSRAGRPDDAANAARAYLQRFPNGYRRAEAEKLIEKP